MSKQRLHPGFSIAPGLATALLALRTGPTDVDGRTITALCNRELIVPYAFGPCTRYSLTPLGSQVAELLDKVVE